MSLATEKKRIIEALNDTKEEWVIKGIMRLLNLNEPEQRVVGYTSKGTPITSRQLKNRARAASERVTNGNYISQEDIEKAL